MSPELEPILERIEVLERRNRGLQYMSLLAVIMSLGVVGYVVGTRLSPLPGPAQGQPGTVEARRILLKDDRGTVRGGMEVEATGGVKLVIGNQDGQTGAAVILAQPTGVVQIQLRSPSGVVRAAMNAGIEPSLTLTSDDGASSAALLTKTGNPGQLLLSDRSGALRRGP